MLSAMTDRVLFQDLTTWSPRHVIPPLVLFLVVASFSGKVAVAESVDTMNTFLVFEFDDISRLSP